MKRLFAFCLSVVLLLSVSFAESLVANEPEELSEHKFISLNDEGLPISALLNLIGCGVTSYSGPNQTGEPVFDEAAHEFLLKYQQINDLSLSGCFDVETICCAIGIEDGDLRLVWLPMHGGQRYHRKESCSKMIEPRQIPLCAAEFLEYTPCGICCRNF